VAKGQASWKAYVDYFSNIVVDGFSNAIVSTINYLLKQIEPKMDTGPLLEISIELVAPDIVWKPELHEGVTTTGVRDMLKKWLMSFLEIGQLMKRLDFGEGNYTKELEEDFDVYDAMNQVRNLIVMNQSIMFVLKWNGYNLLLHLGVLSKMNIIVQLRSL
jgi:dynein heavy chain